uniref:Lipoma-preferred partner n=1 Tax=Syphacia muris TaxID=451379 RepID=A0A0N5AUS3_9BILA
LIADKCSACGEAIAENRPGCRALEKTFHIACFKCDVCGKTLAGSSFYNVNGKPLCEADYTKTLEKCAKCGEVITERLLRASGSAYHPKCFVCTVCKKSLDNVQYTLDSENKIHCIPCFQDLYAPRCAVCSKPIIPKEGETESVRIVAMDKSFHIDCYRCEDCHAQLSSKIEGQGCYPIDQHLYCKTCSGKRIIEMSKAS